MSLLSTEINSIKNLIQYEKVGNTAFLIKIIALMIGAVFAGFTANNFHPDFLKEFEKIPFQLATFFLIAFSFFDSDISKWWIMLFSSLIFTFIFRFSKRKIDEYYNEKKRKNNNNLN